MSYRYILGEDGKTPVPAGDLLSWAMAMEKRDKDARGPAPGASWACLDFTFVSAAVQVSTVFLGLDHRFGADGPPVVFETMTFGGPFDQEQDRYSTWEEAEAGHAAAVARAKAAMAASFCDVEPRS